MDKTKVDVLKISLLIVSTFAMFYIFQYTGAYSHEIINKNIFRQYGINSTITMFFPERIVSGAWQNINGSEYALSETSPNRTQFIKLAESNYTAFEIMIYRLKSNESLPTQQKQIIIPAIVGTLGYMLFYVALAWLPDIKKKMVKKGE